MSAPDHSCASPGWDRPWSCAGAWYEGQLGEVRELLREARELLPHGAYAGWRHDERGRLVERIDAALVRQKTASTPRT